MNRNLSHHHPAFLWRSLMQYTGGSRPSFKQAKEQPSKQFTCPQTRITVIDPQAIPQVYLEQISTLLKTYLDFDLPADQVVAYFSHKYQRFVLLTTADGQELVGFVGMNIINIEQAQLIYLGAAVVKSGYRGGTKLYQPLFYRILWHKVRHPRRKSYIFGVTINPYAYASIARRTAAILPSPAQPHLPAPLIQLAIKGLRKIYGDDYPAYIDTEKGYFCPEISIDLLEEKRPDSTNPALRFFVERNPDYKQGIALIFVVPLTLQTLRQAFSTLVMK